MEALILVLALVAVIVLIAPVRQPRTRGTRGGITERSMAGRSANLEQGAAELSDREGMLRDTNQVGTR